MSTLVSERLIENLIAAKRVPLFLSEVHALASPHSASLLTRPRVPGYYFRPRSQLISAVTKSLGSPPLSADVRLFVVGEVTCVTLLGVAVTPS